MVRLIVFSIVAIISLQKEIFAQGFYNNGASMIIINGTVFTVKDSLVNKGTLTNNGNMVMGGVWLNLGTYNPGNGEITFNSQQGDDSQIINHNSQSFSKLTISGGGEKVILADMTIVGELILSDGIITQENNAQIKFLPTATIIGGSASSHINTVVEHEGTGTKLFPIGDGTNYLPITIQGISTATTTVRASVISNTQSLEPDFDVANLFENRYWLVETEAGSLEGATVTLPLFALTSTAPTSDVIVTQAASLNSKFNSLGQSNFTGDFSLGTVTSNLFPSEPILAIGLASGLEGDVVVFNAVSPNGDGLNDFLEIANIERYPNNKVSLFNRWGDLVVEINAYNNTTNVFKGIGKNGTALSAGTYFYKIELDGTKEPKTGYISVK